MDDSISSSGEMIVVNSIYSHAYTEIHTDSIYSITFTWVIITCIPKKKNICMELDSIENQMN